jgi:lysine/ornithine N-monooxygenase
MMKSDFEFILAQCKKYHFTVWNEKALDECREILPSLTREELLRLYRSKWVNETLRKAVFKVLFADKIGQREKRIKTMPTEELVEEFQDKKSGNVALIRKEMQARYKENVNGDRCRIAAAFRVSTKRDLQWVKSQERKEIYDNLKNNNWGDDMPF